MTNQRFWSKVEIDGPDQCWPWVAGLRTTGYGAFRWHGRNVAASRVAWELTNGAIPRDLCVLHRCDNRRCCNPSHLFLGTHLDNIADRVAKGRSKGALPGTANHLAVLTEQTLLDAQTRWAAGESMSAIARDLGVNRSTIHRAINRKTYA